MVLISHKYKFIYIKNYKVGGTSCEVFFQQFCVNNNNQEYNNLIYLYRKLYKCIKIFLI